MKTTVVNNQDYELWVLLHQVSDAISKAREEELRQYGISMIQAGVLFIVKTAKAPVTPAEISRWLFREPHTVSGLLNRMEKQGLIKKTKDLDRKNLIRVTLTDKGEKAYQKSRQMKVVPKILNRLSQKEREAFRAQLEKLRTKSLNEIGMKRKLPFP
jgi:DNA-binding MarR family transcriptional regulator